MQNYDSLVVLFGCETWSFILREKDWGVSEVDAEKSVVVRGRKGQKAPHNENFIIRTIY